jgi:hypothetical protein
LVQSILQLGQDSVELFTHLLFQFPSFLNAFDFSVHEVCVVLEIFVIFSSLDALELLHSECTFECFFSTSTHIGNQLIFVSLFCLMGVLLALSHTHRLSALE